MDDRTYVYATAGVIGLMVATQVLRKGFDPFAPLWLFLAGYMQVYVVQALSYREWALDTRGVEVVTAANARALWALLLFLGVYHCGPVRPLARALPKPPRNWSVPMVSMFCPLLIAWGLACSYADIRYGAGVGNELSPEAALLSSFPVVMLVAGIVLIVTGRAGERPRPAYTTAGVAVVVLYALIWIFCGKRSHPLFAVLTGTCAFYTSKFQRPSKGVLAAMAFVGALVVSVAINWRTTRGDDRSVAGFSEYLGTFSVSSMLADLNLQSRHDEVQSQTKEHRSKESEEYGGFILMMDTVPEKADYSYGSSYLRLVSTYIPRMFWPNKPFYGRREWLDAWIAGSEFKRGENFIGPAIGILGAAQLNGGAVATAILMTVLALMLRSAYEYFRLYQAVPWVQAWWSLTFYNAWLMTVNDDPFVWFYYVYGHTTLPPLLVLWFYHKFAKPAGTVAEAGVGVPDFPGFRAAGA